MIIDGPELAKQIRTYADAFTAFAFVQASGAALLIGQNMVLACNVRNNRVVALSAVVCSYLIYIFIATACHRAENKLYGKGGIHEQPAPMGEIAGTMRLTRMLIIAIAGIGLTALLCGVAFGPYGQNTRSI